MPMLLAEGSEGSFSARKVFFFPGESPSSIFFSALPPLSCVKVVPPLSTERSDGPFSAGEDFFFPGESASSIFFLALAPISCVEEGPLLSAEGSAGPFSGGRCPRHLGRTDPKGKGGRIFYSRGLSEKDPERSKGKKIIENIISGMLNGQFPPN